MQPDHRSLVGPMARGDLCAPVVLVFAALLMVGLNFVSDPRAMDVSLVPRLLALQFLLFFAVAALVWTKAVQKVDFAVLRDAVVVCFAAYALWTIVSQLSSLNVSAGWTDVFRTFAAAIVLSLGCLVLPAWPSWMVWLVRLGVVAAFLALAVGAYDYWQSPNAGTYRRADMEQVMGLMSNVNLYASFLLLLLPLCLAGVFTSRGLWRGSALTAGLLLLTAIGLLQTRAVYLGVLVFLFTAAGIILLFRARFGLSARCGWMLGSGLAAVLLAVVVFAARNERNPVAERLRSLLQESSLTAAGGRPAIWLNALQMARDHPLTGVGAGNFPVRLHDYFDVEDPTVSEIHPNFVRPHNDFLWILAEKGFPGLFLFGATLFFAAAGLLRALRRGLAPPEAWLAVGVLSVLAGYTAVSLFDFPLERINHQVYLALYLAMAVVLSRDTAASLALREDAPRPAGLAAVRTTATLVLMLLGLGIAYSSAALRQERYIREARSALSGEDWLAVVDNARQARTAWKDLDPLATPVAYLEGLGLMLLAKNEEALACLEEADRQLPGRLYLLNSLAVLHSVTGNSTQALQYLQQVLQRSPDSMEARYRLGLGYLRSGQPDRAVEVLRQIPADSSTPEMSAALREAVDAAEPSQR